MAKQTIQSSYHDMVVTNLLCELELKVDEAVRCQEMIDRLSTYKPEDKLPVEVVDFIGNYADIQIVSQEASAIGLVVSAGALLKNALDALMKAINWIITKLREIFKFCFDKEFRACKDMLDLQRRLITLSVDMPLKNKFENASCDVITKAYVDKMIQMSNTLITLIENASKLTDVKYVETLLNEHGDDGAMMRGADGRMYDNIPDPEVARNTTYQAAGWTFTGINDTVTQFLAVLKGIEGLKDTSKRLDSAASDLKKRAEEAALTGAGSDKVNALQTEAATKIAMTKVIGYSVAILVRRSDSILAFVKSLYDEIVAIKKA